MYSGPPEIQKAFPKGEPFVCLIPTPQQTILGLFFACFPTFFSHATCILAITFLTLSYYIIEKGAFSKFCQVAKNNETTLRLKM